jgi:CO/xanthine dehydrogenase FAD-binding subunit
MIIEYLRPQTLEETLQWIARPHPLTLPLGGGTVLNAPHTGEYAVADLQSLPLKSIVLRGSTLEIGATTTLQALLDFSDLQPALKTAIQHEATYNLRQVGTMAGTLIASDGRSPFAAAMLALDAQLALLPGDEQSNLGDVLHLRQSLISNSSISNTQYPTSFLPHRLITTLILSTKTALAYQYVARTPADRPLVTVAAARWPSGRVRIVVGGWGGTPRLALDAPEAGGVEFAVRNITAEAGDQWGSAEYRQDVAVTLAKRAMEAIGS